MKTKKHLSASAEDYLESIYVFCKKNGVARSKEIMERLNVSGPSVTEALQSLSKKGLVNYTPYEAITLTEAGEKIARDVLHRHETLKEFFAEVLGVEPKLAEEGACKMEHVAPPEVIERMVLYTTYLKDECQVCECEKSLRFEDYLQKNSY